MVYYSTQLARHDLVKTKIKRLTTEFLSMESSKAFTRLDRESRNSRTFIIMSNGLLTMVDVDEKDNIIAL